MRKNEWQYPVIGLLFSMLMYSGIAIYVHANQDQPAQQKLL